MALNWQGLEREVAVRRTAIVAAVTAVLHLVISLHWLTVAQSDETIRVVTGALDLLGAGTAALFVRAGVSPASASGSVDDLVGTVADLASPASDVPVIQEPRNPNSPT